MRLRNISGSLRKAACLAFCLLLLCVSLLTAGCSTPRVAATVGNKEYSTADYLAYLYNAYQTTFYYNQLSYYSYYGMDPWGQELTYGEGDKAEKVSVEEYITRLTKDTMIRQKALEDLMAKYNISISKDDLDSLAKYMESVSADTLIPMGFNKETYEKMYKAVTYNESSLFYGLYDKGGQRAMADNDIRTYYDKNIITYKTIEISLTDDQGSDLDAAGVAAVKAKLQKYLNQYNTSKDFDKVITQYNADKEAESTTTAATTTTTTAAGATTTTAAGATTTAAAASTTTTTTAATTTTTTATTTTAAATTTTTAASGEGTGTADDTDENMKTLDANTADDAALLKAVQSVAVGKAAIVEYKKSGTTNTAALILRINPEETEYKFANSRQRVIYGAKFDEFDKEVKAQMEELTVSFNKSILKNCTPKKLVTDASNAQ